MLSIIFLHSTLIIKKVKPGYINKCQFWLLYLIGVKNKNIFFVFVLQWFSYTVPKTVTPWVFFVFRFKIPSKVVLNLILIEIVDLLKSLNITQYFSAFNFSKRQTTYSLLRSSFVFKKSQEQLILDLYSGSFSMYVYTYNFLALEYLEHLVIKGLKKLCLFDITVFKSLKG